MKKINGLMQAIALLILFLQSCSQAPGKTSGTDTVPSDKVNVSQEEVPDIPGIEKTYDAWYGYTYRNIHLAQDFTGLDTNGKIISKKEFLSVLSTGNYIPAKLNKESVPPSYKLYPLHSTNPEIRNGLKQIAETERKNFSMQGSYLPPFRFTDIEGNQYDQQNLKGKFVVIKCWFIRCVACVKEFPELNKLADEYRDRKDIKFISLAMDSKPDLQTFLKKTEFKFAVVPNQTDYMVNDLRIIYFPTHILIGKDGKIVSVVNKLDDFTPAFRKMLDGK